MKSRGRGVIEKMSLSQVELDRLSTALKRGAKMLIGTDHVGRRKLKLKKGPFGLFTERISCTEEDLEKLKKLVKSS
jgi:hypothetical protein